mmetsp:Transcript_12226/g.28296  ORF Transcript_12226/g.28296 Transcript_12226/m.28296 type:complete len:206 (-) Transcript_12226:487-1104(-)
MRKAGAEAGTLGTSRSLHAAHAEALRALEDGSEDRRRRGTGALLGGSGRDSVGGRGRVLLDEKRERRRHGAGRIRPLPLEVVASVRESERHIVRTLLEVVTRLACGSPRQPTELSDKLALHLGLLLTLASLTPHEDSSAWPHVAGGQAVDAHELEGVHVLTHADRGEAVERTDQDGDEHRLKRLAAIAHGRRGFVSGAVADAGGD